MGAVVIWMCRHRIAASRHRPIVIDAEPSNVTSPFLADYATTPLTSPGYVQTGFDGAGMYPPNNRSSYNNSHPTTPHSGTFAAGEMSEHGYAPPPSGAWPSEKSRRGVGLEGGLTPATELAYARFNGQAPGSSGQASSNSRLSVPSAGASSASRSMVSYSAVSQALSDMPFVDPSRASQLTPAQLDFVSNLINLNVPAADIAGVMERMREDGGEGESSSHAGLRVVNESHGVGLGDVKSAPPPTDEELPQYEPRSQ